MPCDQKITAEVELSKMDHALVLKAVEAMGGYGSTTARGLFLYVPGFGAARLEGTTLSLQAPSTEQVEILKNKLKLGYAKEVVKASAKAFGWNATVDKTNALKMSLKRRS